MPLDGTIATYGTEYSSDAPVPGSQSVLQERELPPSWIDAAEDKLRELLELEDGWDTYGAPAIESDTVQAASILLRMLARAVRDLPMPSIVPTAAGGVEIEWSTPADDVVASLELVPGGTLVLYHDDGDQEVESAFPDFGPFLRVLSQIAEMAD
jgi:hypothetical protein